jgi:hypothetical protein
MKTSADHRQSSAVGDVTLGPNAFLVEALRDIDLHFYFAHSFNRLWVEVAAVPSLTFLLFSKILVHKHAIQVRKHLALTVA